jgi:DNA-binding NtrC family response regulator
MADVRPFQGAAVEMRDGVVLGPALRACWDEIAGAAPAGALHITGESGSGKELAARHFHRSGAQADGPFVAASCAALSPANFARHLQTARAGTLFLDDAGELDPELRPALAAAAARAEPRICTAAMRLVPGLRAVRLPPLRRRLEEIPWLMQSRGLAAHVSLVEACVTRPWPGNVRELIAELGVAEQRAQAQDAERVTAEHLAPIAGSAPH